jgi:hypothetical protein
MWMSSEETIIDKNGFESRKSRFSAFLLSAAVGKISTISVKKESG